MRRARLAVAVALLASTAAACSNGDDSAGPTTSPTTPSTTAAAGTAPPPARVRGIKLTELARLDQPTAMALRSGDNAVYVAEKTGRVRRLVDFRPTGPPVIDVSGNLSLGSEQGLLGLTFSPDGATAYINYTDARGDTHIASHPMSSTNPTELTDLLFVDQPYANHNGGQLAFGPDGLLYIGLGDGGSQNDPRNNAQNPKSNLGKILRVDVRSGAKPEVFALGLRNPWRFSFDRATGDLWIADVGGSRWEEIDVDRAPLDVGRNYGWPQREGRHANKSGGTPAGAVEPEFEYDHDDGSCSVTGGYVYRGAALKTLLDGVYLYADYCKGDLMGVRDGKAEDLKVHVEAPSSFGEDAAGELYVLSLRGQVYRLEAQS